MFLQGHGGCQNFERRVRWLEAIQISHDSAIAGLELIIDTLR
jgi:hypothetical protein